MKILLIMPPFERLKGLRFSYFPIGLGYIAAYLEKRGVDVRIYNAENPPPDENLSAINYRRMFSQYDNYLRSLEDDNHVVWKELSKILKEASPDIVGLSVATAKSGSALKISSLCKRNSRSLVVWGGPQPTIQPEETLKNKDIDFIIRGEGERTFDELIQALKTGSGDFSRIKGLSYRKKGRIVHNEDRSLIENLDELPFPTRNRLIYPERCMPWDMGVMIASRGCSFRCAYCGSHNIWGSTTRPRSIDNIIEEIKKIIESQRLKQVFFWDDTFNINRQRVAALCSRLISEKINIAWRCTARIDLLDDELLGLMRKSGCVSMDIGIETGSRRMLSLIKKGITKQQILHGMKIIKKHGINFNAFFMLGFPDEREEDIRETYELMRSKEIGNIILSIFTPYAGTELYKRSKDLGLIPSSIDVKLFSHLSPHNHFVKKINRERFRKIVDEISMYVDKHNSSFRAFLKIHKTEIPFYTKNPYIFFRKLINKLKDLR